MAIRSSMRRIGSLECKTAVKSTGANTAVATANFVIFMEPRSVTLDLVNTPAGWRIADIRWPRGSLRTLYKLK